MCQLTCSTPTNLYRQYHHEPFFSTSRPQWSHHIIRNLLSDSKPPIKPEDKILDVKSMNELKRGVLLPNVTHISIIGMFRSFIQACGEAMKLEDNLIGPKLLPLYPLSLEQGSSRTSTWIAYIKDEEDNRICYT